jgi:hypothetical protein
MDSGTVGNRTNKVEDSSEKSDGVRVTAALEELFYKYH